MPDHPQQPGPRYRVVGIRPDGSREIVKGGLTEDEAKQEGGAIEKSRVFASVYIEQESVNKEMFRH